MSVQLQKPYTMKKSWPLKTDTIRSTENSCIQNSIHEGSKRAIF
jgi:hypothetical protein